MQKSSVKLGLIANEFDIQLMYNSGVFHPPRWINFDTNAIIMVCVISVNYCSDHTSWSVPGFKENVVAVF